LEKKSCDFFLISFCLSTNQTQMTTPFPFLQIPYNDQGWGPAPNSLPAAFATLPFAAFGRGEKVGKAADFGNFLTMRQRGMFRRGVDENVDLAGALYEVGDSEFIMVDTAKTPRRGGYNAGGRGGGSGGGGGGGGGRGGGSRGGFNNRGGRGGVNVGARGWEDRQSERKGSDGSSFNKRYNKLTQARWVQSSIRNQRLLRDASVRVASDWLQLELLDFTHLVKMSAVPSTAKDLKWFGQLDAYDEEFDRTSAKKATKLRNFANKSMKSVGSKNDTVFEELAGNGAGNVFATESVLSHLMACGRSFYPWDIVITYVGGTLFLDAREPQDFDLLSVNENSHVIPSEEDPEDINGRRRLALEATLINQDFSQQVSFFSFYQMPSSQHVY
jgi:translation initiation factor 3 subunit D